MAHGLAGGVTQQQPRLLVGRREKIIGDGCIVAPQSKRVHQDKPTDSPRMRGGDLSGHHAAERMSDQVDLAQAQCLEEIVVVKHEVIHSIEVTKLIWFVGSGVSPRAHPAASREALPKSAPFLSKQSVEIDDRRAVALDEDPIGLTNTQDPTALDETAQDA